MGKKTLQVALLAFVAGTLLSCRAVPPEIQKRDFGANVPQDAVTACMNTANAERDDLKLYQNLTTAFGLLVVVVGVMGSILAAFLQSPKSRRQAGATFAGLTIIFGAVPNTFEDPQKVRDSFTTRRRLWEEAVSAEGEVEEVSSAIIAIKEASEGTDPAAITKAKLEVKKLSRHVKDVLEKCIATVPTDPPPRPVLSDEVFALAADIDTVKVAVAERPELDSFRTQFKANPMKSRPAIKVFVEKNAAMSAKRKEFLNDLEPVAPP